MSMNHILVQKVRKFSKHKGGPGKRDTKMEPFEQPILQYYNPKYKATRCESTPI